MATIEEIKSLLCLDLDNTSGSGIKWIVTGKQAGTQSGGYYQVIVNGCRYYAHHVVLLLVNRQGILDIRKQKGLSRLLVVDHINNGIYPHNSNHPDNLQIVTQRENILKRNYRVSNSGHSNIIDTGYSTYKVSIKIGTLNRIQKTFKQLEDAIKYRDNLITSNSK